MALFVTVCCVCCFGSWRGPPDGTQCWPRSNTIPGNCQEVIHPSEAMGSVPENARVRVFTPVRMCTAVLSPKTKRYRTDGRKSSVLEEILVSMTPWIDFDSLLQRISLLNQFIWRFHSWSKRLFWSYSFSAGDNFNDSIWQFAWPKTCEGSQIVYRYSTDFSKL